MLCCVASKRAHLIDFGESCGLSWRMLSAELRAGSGVAGGVAGLPEAR